MEPEDEGAEGKRREGVTAGEEFILLFSFTLERERGGGGGGGCVCFGKVPSAKVFTSQEDFNFSLLAFFLSLFVLKLLDFFFSSTLLFFPSCLCFLFLVFPFFLSTNSLFLPALFLSCLFFQLFYSVFLSIFLTFRNLFVLFLLAVRSSLFQ